MVRNKNRPNIIIRVIALLAAVLLGLSPASALAADMIDVSSWQTGINVTTTGAQIVVAKATESTNYVNPDCDRVVQQALAQAVEICCGFISFYLALPLLEMVLSLLQTMIGG